MRILIIAAMVLFTAYLAPERLATETDAEQTTESSDHRTADVRIIRAKIIGLNGTTLGIAELKVDAHTDTDTHTDTDVLKYTLNLYEKTIALLKEKDPDNIQPPLRFRIVPNNARASFEITIPDEDYVEYNVIKTDCVSIMTIPIQIEEFTRIKIVVPWYPEYWGILKLNPKEFRNGEGYLDSFLTIFKKDAAGENVKVLHVMPHFKGSKIFQQFVRDVWGLARMRERETDIEKIQEMLTAFNRERLLLIYNGVVFWNESGEKVIVQFETTEWRQLLSSEYELTERQWFKFWKTNEYRDKRLFHFPCLALEQEHENRETQRLVGPQYVTVEASERFERYYQRDNGGTL